MLAERFAIEGLYRRMAMSMTVAEQFVEVLVTAGVKRVYGIVGDSLNGLTEAIRSHDEIEWIHVRHEEVAAFAAGAEAHLTGSLTVCAGSCGPGNLHLINGLFDCHRSGVPVLAIAAHIPSSEGHPGGEAPGPGSRPHGGPPPRWPGPGRCGQRAAGIGDAAEGDGGSGLPFRHVHDEGGAGRQG